MKIGTVAVIGSGITGKTIAKTLTEKYPELNVIMFGEPPLDLEDDNSNGLFYTDEMIPNIAEIPIKITSSVIDDEDFESRKHKQKWEQVTDRIELLPESTGYLLNENIDMSDVDLRKEFVSSIDLTNKTLITMFGKGYIHFDYVISTINLSRFYDICRLSSINNFLQSHPIYIDISKGIDNYKKTDLDKIEIVFNLKDSSPYYRQAYYWDKDGHLAEVKEESLKKLKGMNVIRLKPGKVVTDSISQKFVNDIEENYPFVKLEGRYGRWDEFYLLSNSYDSSLKYMEEKIKEL